jgi:hypothetical protein
MFFMQIIAYRWQKNFPQRAVAMVAKENMALLSWKGNEVTRDVIRIFQEMKIPFIEASIGQSEVF